ncbi:hypothetical protein [Chelativorans oligotrophicus]|uniref:hypothetical protein n=1 Tax=Chelativorans oligotrophicus TaxID=449974 RepID=UPI00140C17A8|nr:hypothetical protein [Chelativorans oligotrophicus]
MSLPLRMAFVGEVSEAIRRAAEERKLKPQVLTAALMRAVMEGDLIDSVLEGNDARKLAGGQARDLETGLTLLQEGLVYLIGLNTGRDGVCRLPVAGFQARLSGSTFDGVKYALTTICSKGFARRVGTGTRYTPQPYALTPAGERVYQQLSGAQADGGEG